MIQFSGRTEPIRDGLLRAGFPEDYICPDVPVPGNEPIPLVAFSNRPFDSRTASVAVLSGDDLTASEVAAVRPVGASIVFGCLPDHYDIWKQRPTGPEMYYSNLRPREVHRFFDEHATEFAPESIYRAKVWGRLDHNFQLDFVDAGFLPVVEEEAGRKLTELIERVVADTKHGLAWRERISAPNGQWLLKSTFWLLAAKILKDKGVPGFIRLNLTDIEDVYMRLAKHYNSEDPRPVTVGDEKRRHALVFAAEQIKMFGHCGAVSTEALAYLYESALIDRVTRQKLGTHSTPGWLVDYIVGRLRPWVERDIPAEDRRVFEPACGHAAFLIAAMRLLSELLPKTWPEPRHTYLRRRLNGIEADSFAFEIAQLSLTLADVPNHNGWALTEQNMFSGSILENGVRRATIALGNPPFESFVPAARRPGWLTNKAAETFRRIVEFLPPGGVLGFVLPRTFLRANQSKKVRQILLREYEISEITVFADQVFSYGDSESCVIIARRRTNGFSRDLAINYRRVREGQVAEFSRTYRAGSSSLIRQGRLSTQESASLLVPDLEGVWENLRGLPALENFADIGKSDEGDIQLVAGSVLSAQHAAFEDRQSGAGGRGFE